MTPVIGWARRHPLAAGGGRRGHCYWPCYWPCLHCSDCGAGAKHFSSSYSQRELSCVRSASTQQQATPADSRYYNTLTPVNGWARYRLAREFAAATVYIAGRASGALLHASSSRSAPAQAPPAGTHYCLDPLLTLKLTVPVLKRCTSSVPETSIFVFCLLVRPRFLPAPTFYSSPAVLLCSTTPVALATRPTSWSAPTAWFPPAIIPSCCALRRQGWSC